MNRSMEWTSKALLLILKLTIATMVASVLSNVFLYVSYQSLPPSASYEDTFLAADYVAGFVGFARLAIMILLAVFFLMWVYRTTASLRLFSGQPMSQTPGWAVGWYFVPFAYLFMPYRGMKDIWRAVHDGEPEGYGIIRLWWALHLLSMLIWSLIPLDEIVSVSDALEASIIQGFADTFDLALYATLAAMCASVWKAYQANISERAIDHPEIPAGWYSDPVDASLLRYWDGLAWSEATHPAGGETVVDVEPALSSD